MITVGNKNRGDTGLYIGRGSVLGNPYPIDAEHDRAAVVALFREHLRRDWQAHGPMRREVEALAHRALAGEDLTLVCFCAPQECHGEVIKAAIEGCIRVLKSRA